MATYAAFKHIELFNVGNTKKRVLKPPGGGSSDIFGGESSGTPRASVRNHQTSNIFAVPEQSYKNGENTRRPASNNSHNRLFGDAQRSPTTVKHHMKSSIPIGGDGLPPQQTTSNGEQPNHQNGNGKSAAAAAAAASTVTRSNGHANGNHRDVELSPGSDKKNDELNGCSQGPATPISNGGGSCSVYSAMSTGSSSTVSSLHDSPNGTGASNKLQIKSSNRNPVTGLGIALPNDRQKKMSQQIRGDGNPVTGEGYKPAGTEINTSIPSLNGAKQVINKNRIPPGGFSSGLW